MNRKTLLLLLITINIGLFSQTQLNSLKEIIDFSLNNNLDLRKSYVSLDKSKEDIESYIKVDKTKISTTGKYSEDGTISFDSSISIPIIDQVTLSGSIDNDLDGSIGISINPLSHNKDVELSKLDYEVAVASNNEAIKNLEISITESALNWMSGYRSFLLKEKEEERYNTLYKDDKDRYNNGSITLDELQESLINWSDSRKALLVQKQNLYTLETSLYTKLGTTTDLINIKRFEVKELIEYVKELKDSLVSKEGSYTKNYDYQSSIFSATKANYNNQALWAIDPDVSASLKVDIDDSGITADSFVASLTVELSLDSFKKTAKKQLTEEYLISLKDKELKLNKAKMEFEESKDLVESSEIETEISLHEYEQAILLLSEADILHKAGEYSELDLLQSQIFLQQAENNLFSALKNEYINILNYLKYF